MRPRKARPHNPLPTHPILGQEVNQHTGRERCSRCKEPIPPDTVPLMLFGPDRAPLDCQMFVYCDTCAPSIIALLKPGWP
jgi:hypothetical protein